MTQWIDRYGIHVAVMCLSFGVIIGTLTDLRLGRQVRTHTHPVILDDVIFHKNSECWSLALVRDQEGTGLLNDDTTRMPVRPVVFVRVDCPE